jgi:N-acetylmuramoyl-L-alanine amidase
LGLIGAAGAQEAADPVAKSAPVPANHKLLVLLDPGHGGTNTGAPSIREDIFEKHVTLAVAGTLRAKLQRKGIEVRLTRTKDEYLTLRQRGRMANEMNADLFVSVHVNATENHSHSGYETFILTPEAVDVDSRALRHNSGRARPGLDAKTCAILDDIERSTTQVRAADVATSIQDNMRTLRGKAGDRGVRQDSMHVLLGATMPAVLVELGFIDHPIEGEELMDPKVRDKMADAIADAIFAHAEALASR